MTYTLSAKEQMDEERINAFKKFCHKYEQLVWYARKAPAWDEEYWSGVPEHIKDGALNAASRVEEQYPDEIAQLKTKEIGDWSHGFNSGCLATMRFVLEALSSEYWTDEFMTGLEMAEENFPELDT